MHSSQASSPRHLLCTLQRAQTLQTLLLQNPPASTALVNNAHKCPCILKLWHLQGKVMSKSQVFQHKFPNSSYHIHGQISQSTGNKHTSEISKTTPSPECFIGFCQNGSYTGQAYTGAWWGKFSSASGHSCLSPNWNQRYNQVLGERTPILFPKFTVPKRNQSKLSTTNNSFSLLSAHGEWIPNYEFPEKIAPWLHRADFQSIDTFLGLLAY